MLAASGRTDATPAGPVSDLALGRGQRRALVLAALTATVIASVVASSLQVSERANQFDDDSAAGVPQHYSRQHQHQQEQFQRFKSKNRFEPTPVASNTNTNTNNNNNNNNNNNYNRTHSQPYWRRPGCHLVGHTRTISIPGCVKFNLSTNACRGYCMSYSIPSAADLGPIGSRASPSSSSSSSSSSSMSASQSQSSLPASQLPFPDTKSPNVRYKVEWRAPVGRRHNSEPAAAAPQAAVAGVTQSDIEPALVVITDDDQLADPMTTTTVAPVSSAASAARPLRYTLQQLQQHLAGRHPLRRGPGTRTAAVSYDDTSPDGADTDADADTGTGAGLQRASAMSRDVVSVGQCCNMMETEDVFVNLRCGPNETRRLVFRSAKTCECFFCKHV